MIEAMRLFISCLRECVTSLWDGQDADADNLAEDWRRIGDDLRHAMGCPDDGDVWTNDTRSCPCLFQGVPELPITKHRPATGCTDG